MHQWYLFILWIIESTNEIIFSLMNSLVRWRLDGNAWPAWTVTTVLFRTTLTRTIMLNLLLTPGFKPFIVKPVLMGHPRDSRDCWTGPSCSIVGQRYLLDKSLSSGYVLEVYPVDRVTLGIRGIVEQALVVQPLDSAIYRINHCPVDTY